MIVSVDVIGLVLAYLKNHPDVQAAVSSRVYSLLPATPVYPLAEVQRVGGVIQPYPAWNDGALLQIDVWGRLPKEGGGLKEAWDVAAAVRGALAVQEIRGAHDLGIVVDSSEVSGPQMVYDPPEGRPRYTWRILLRVHPLAA